MMKSRCTGWFHLPMLTRELVVLSAWLLLVGLLSQWQGPEGAYAYGTYRGQSRSRAECKVSRRMAHILDSRAVTVPLIQRLQCCS
jgi:hypothetical protein